MLHKRVLLFANTDWYLYNFRLPLALALREQGWDVVLVAPPGPYAQRFETHGLRFVPFHFDRRSLNPLHQLSAVARLAALYRRERPDLVHHFTIKCAAYGSLAARLSGGPAVVNALAGLGSVFAPSDNDRRFRVTRKVVLRTLRIALAGTHVIVQNADDRRQMLETALADEARMHLIRGSGVDLDRFKPAVAPRTGPLRVLFASRLLRSKGIAAFETMAARLRKTHDAEFVVAGAPDPGNPDTLTTDEIDAMAVRGAVRLLGHVEDMPALLAATDIAVLPTVYAEGVPKILIEAAAAGVPLVANDVAGCREIVRTGENGTLVPAGNPEINLAALTDAVGALLANAALRSRMGAASRRIAAEFSHTRVIAETLAVYAEALRGRPAGSLASSRI